MAKLYTKDNHGQYVWAVSDNKDKSRPPKCLYACDHHNEWELTGLKHGHVIVGNAYPIGMYDQEGFYCVHLPPIAGAEGKRAMSRYVRHPHADETAKLDAERDEINQRYGAKH